jgi:hypothetical protein
MSCQILPDWSEKAELSVERRNEVNDSIVMIGGEGAGVLGTGREIEEFAEGRGVGGVGVTAVPSCLSRFVAGAISGTVAYLSKIIHRSP